MDEFDALDTAVIALSQEDKDLESAARFVKGMPEPVPFDVVFDFDRKKSAVYDRTTAYLIDEHGVVRQVFPMLIHFRPSWDAILGEVRALAAAEK